MIGDTKGVIMEIKKSYLMWVGSESYKDIATWTEEAAVQGISKRLPNVAVGRKLQEDGSVVFVAHDEGESHDCDDCIGIVENPERRKIRSAVKKLRKEIHEIQDKIKNFPFSRYNVEEYDKGVKPLERLKQRRADKIAGLEVEFDDQDETIESGTGGWVDVETTPCVIERWDYRKYNYWLHQPGKFDVNKVRDKEMCSGCGGTGLLPNSKIFGIFIPGCVEYIMKKDDTDKVRRRMEAQGIRVVTQGQLVTEKMRKCGYRIAGGIYVVTETGDEPTSKATRLVEMLIDKGIVSPDGVEVKGNFIRFVNPIETDVKRFRGIKSWNLDPAAEDEAEMILDAISAD